MKLPLTVLLLASALAGTVLSVPPVESEVAQSSAGDQLFRERIYPVLQANCFKCHGPDVRRVKGGLRMSDRESLLKGGSSGPAIDIQDPEASLLLELVRHADPEFAMPPDNPLDPDSVADLRLWIELGAPWPGAEVASDPQAEQFFQDEVRPVLAARCFPCHGPDVPEPRSGLRMSGREALLKGSRFGPSLVPGDPDASRLIRAVRYNESSLKMPPTEPLPANEVAILERWVAMGAPWPGGESLGVSESHNAFDVDTARARWPFTPVERPVVPSVDDAQFDNPIDAFVLQRLQAAGLEPSPRATDRELIRRAYADLIGLPPSYEDVERYVASDSPNKWVRLIDELLGMQAYGERWGRQWLDVVRFAQSDGYEIDAEKAYAWRYRDYVIQAFNDDLPYDRFIEQQIAGDELEPDSDAALIATGIYQIGPYEEGDEIADQVRLDGYDDVLRVMTEGFMGLTIGCARCHDHEYDPVRQDDYYGLLAFIDNVRPYALAVYSPESTTLSALGFDSDARAEWDAGRVAYAEHLRAEGEAILIAQRRRALEKLVSEQPAEARQAYLTPEDQRSSEQQRRVDELAQQIPGEKRIFKSLQMHDKIRYQTLLDNARRADEGENFEGAFPWVLRVTEFGSEPEATHVMALGMANSPLHAVKPQFPPVLVPSDRDAHPDLPLPPAGGATSGRRSVLAKWIASADHPLTARVMANRVWQGHFGRGIVATPNDFGGSGVPPTHPELLDWLASEFVDRGWSVKQLHRLIMSSDAYQRSSGLANEPARELDPGNDLFWRQNLRRLDAESLRDALLATSGELNDKAGGRGFFPELSREALGGSSKPGDGWGVSSPSEQSRRAVYAFVKRGMLEPMLDVFDCANPVLPVGTRAETTTANQSLMLLNSDFVNGRAAALASRVRREIADRDANDGARIERLFQLVLGRNPSADELTTCRDYLDRQVAAFGEVESWIALQPQVPDRVQDDYLDELAPQDMLFGPREGWTYVRGLWGNSYNNTREVDSDRGPAGLSPVRFVAGRVSAEVRLADGCRFGSILLRAAKVRDAFAGLELRLDAESGALQVLQHSVFEDLPIATLVSVPFEFEYGRTYAVAIDLEPEAVVVSFDGTRALQVDLDHDESPGQLGLRCWGDTFELRNLRVHVAEGTVAIEPEQRIDPRDRAFESLCLAALNFNEFLYVD